MAGGDVWRVQFERVRDGIEPALGKRPAAAQALHRQHESAARTVARDGLMRIVRTGRMKFARAAEKWSEKNLVATDQREQQPCSCGLDVGAKRMQLWTAYGSVVLRGNSFSNSSPSGENFAVATVLRG